MHVLAPYHIRLWLLSICCLHGMGTVVFAQLPITYEWQYRDLRRSVSVDAVRTDSTPTIRYRILHPEAMIDERQPMDLLIRMLDVGSGSTVTGHVTVHSWHAVPSVISVLGTDTSFTLKQIGGFGASDRWAITFNPWRTVDGTLFVADSFTLVVSVTPGEPPPSTQLLEPAPWYHPEGLHVALHTESDGIGMVRGSTILATEPGFSDVPLDSLALIHRGFQEFLAIEDDGDGVVSPEDRFYFQARRAAGDTIWYDRQNSRATFFLASRWHEPRQRLTTVGSVSGLPPVTTLAMRRHIEFDTGYYHLGNARLEDFADYYTPWAPLEGFYWENLNAKAFHRAVHRFRCTPAPASSMMISMRYISGTDVRAYKPDSRADLSVNGLPSVYNVTDGANAFSIQTTLSGPHLAAGIQSLKIFATGIDSLRSRPDYLSQIVLDYYDVNATILPVLDSGVLSGSLETSSGGLLSVWNARTPSVFILDTINHTWSRTDQSNRGTVIRVGLTPADRNWPTDEHDTTVFRMAALFGDQEAVLDSTNDLVLMLSQPSTTVEIYRWSESPDVFRNAAAQARPGTAFAMFHTSTVIDKESERSVQSLLGMLPSGTWCAAGVVGDSSAVWEGRYGVGGSVLDQTGTATTLGTTYTALLPVTKGPAYVFVSDELALQIADVRPANLSSSLVSVPQSDMLIVTHPLHRGEAERLAAHRRRFSNATVAIYSIDNIIDEVGMGYSSAEVLRSFLARLYDTAPLPKPRYLLLMGNASWDPRRAIPRGNAGSKRIDQVPTYGRPSSDYYFGLLDSEADVAVPELIVGRIPALTALESRNHVNKIIAMDTARVGPWMRRWLFVGGGSEQEGLCDLYKNLLTDPFNSGITFTDPPLCLDTTTVCGYEAGSASGYIIKQSIDRGLQWMNYIGHGATDQFDIRGWEPGELLPSSTFGILATYACQTGAFSNPSVSCKNADYLTAPDVGFAAAVGGTGWARIITINYLHYRIHELLRGTSLRTLGDLIYEAKAPFAIRGDQDGINTVMQFCLLGDPMSRIRMDTVPQVYVRSTELRVAADDGSADVTDGIDNVVLTAIVHSSGTGSVAPVSVMAIRAHEGVTDTVVSVIGNGICREAIVQFSFPVLNKAGEHRFTVIVDPQGALNDNPDDNIASVVVTVVPRAMLPLHPLPHQNVSRQRPVIRIVDPLSAADSSLRGSQLSYDVSFAMVRDQDTLVRSTRSEILRDGSLVDWNVDRSSEPLPTGPVDIQVVAAHPVTEEKTAVLTIPAYVVDSAPPDILSTTITAGSFRSERPENVVIDHRDAVLRLSQRRVPIYVRSRGVRTADIFQDRMIQVRIGNILYIDNPFYRGINVVVLNPTDTIPASIRRYDTYRDPDLTPGWHNGTSKDCITFLRDSVAPHQQVLIAAAYESFSGFEQDSTIREFRDVMRTYGSMAVDSLVDNTSWIIYSSPGRTTAYRELWAPPQDSLVTLRDSIVFSADSATVHTPWVGPARRWNAFQSSHSSRGVSWSVVGRTSNGNEVTLLADTTSNEWIPSAVADSCTVVRFSYRLAAGTFGEFAAEAAVSGISGTFEPADEWLIEPLDVRLEQDTVLQADSAVLTVRIRNARIDQTTRPTSVSTQIRAMNGDSPHVVSEIPPLPQDEQVHIRIPLSTSSSAGSAIVSVEVNPESTYQREFYRFNNARARTLFVARDTTAPTIALTANGVDCSFGGFVPLVPSIDVLLRDQSQLEIADPSRLVVFVNGERIRSAVADSVEFLSSSACRLRYGDPTIKAALRFRYPLELGDNNVFVRASDASGNAVERTIVLQTTQESKISSVRARPHPFASEVHLDVTLETSEPRLDATMVLVDSQGRTVRTVYTTLTFGTSTIIWDGRGEDHASLPSGVYGYRLQIAGTLVGSGVLVKLTE